MKFTISILACLFSLAAYACGGAGSEVTLNNATFSAHLNAVTGINDFNETETFSPVTHIEAYDAQGNLLSVVQEHTPAVSVPNTDLQPESATISQGGMTLTCDTITCNLQTGQCHGEGHCTLTIAPPR